MSDAKKRQQYDQFGTTGDAGGFGGGGGFGGAGGFGGGNPEDIFREFMQGMGMGGAGFGEGFSRGSGFRQQSVRASVCLYVCSQLNARILYACTPFPFWLHTLSHSLFHFLSLDLFLSL